MNLIAELVDRMDANADLGSHLTNCKNRLEVPEVRIGKPDWALNRIAERAATESELEALAELFDNYSEADLRSFDHDFRRSPEFIGLMLKADSRVSEVRQSLPELAAMPLTQEHGRKLPTKYVYDEPDSEEPVVTGYTKEIPSKPIRENREVHEATRAVSVYDAVRQRLLDVVLAELGWVTFVNDAGETFRRPMQTRSDDDYRIERYRKHKSVERMLLGGERTSGGVEAGEWDELALIRLSLTASSTPNGVRVSPLDHVSTIKEAWNKTTRQAVSEQMEDLGLGRSDWTTKTSWEPHEGGVNDGYPHLHVLIHVNLEPLLDGRSDRLVRGRLRHAGREAVRRYVNHNPYAGEAAHGEGAVSVVGTPWNGGHELRDAVGYSMNYDSPTFEHILDSSPQEVVFDAVTAAGGYRIFSEGRLLKQMQKADACKFRYETDQQALNHGGRTICKSGTHVCAFCGSPWQIEAASWTQNTDLAVLDVEIRPSRVKLTDDGVEILAWSAVKPPPEWRCKSVTVGGNERACSGGQASRSEIWLPYRERTASRETVQTELTC